MSIPGPILPQCPGWAYSWGGRGLALQGDCFGQDFGLGAVGHRRWGGSWRDNSTGGGLKPPLSSLAQVLSHGLA